MGRSSTWWGCTTIRRSRRELRRHYRAAEVRKLLARIDKAVSAGLDVHLVCGNLVPHQPTFAPQSSSSPSRLSLAAAEKRRSKSVDRNRVLDGVAIHGHG